MDSIETEYIPEQNGYHHHDRNQTHFDRVQCAVGVGDWRRVLACMEPSEYAWRRERSTLSMAGKQSNQTSVLDPDSGDDCSPALSVYAREHR